MESGSTLASKCRPRSSTYQSIMTELAFQLIQANQPSTELPFNRRWALAVSMCHSAEKQTAVNFLNWWGPIIDNYMLTSLICTSGQFCSTQRRRSSSATSLRHPTSAINLMSHRWMPHSNWNQLPLVQLRTLTRNFRSFLRVFQRWAMRCRGSVTSAGKSAS